MIRNMETEIPGFFQEPGDLLLSETSLYPAATAAEECCGNGDEASSDRDFKYVDPFTIPMETKVAQAAPDA